MKIYDLNLDPIYVPASGEIHLDSSYQAVKCFNGKVYYLIDGYISNKLVPTKLLTTEQNNSFKLKNFDFASLEVYFAEHY